MAKNARILGIRLDDHTTQRLTRFEKETLIEGVSLARAALCASLDSYEANGTLSLPLKIVPAQNEAKFTSPTSAPTPFVVTKILGPEVLQPTEPEQKASTLNEVPPVAPALESNRLRRRLETVTKRGTTTR